MTAFCWRFQALAAPVKQPWPKRLKPSSLARLACLPADDFITRKDFDWQRFEQVLSEVHDGKDLHYQPYDWAKDTLSATHIDIPAPKLVIVEGVRIIQPDYISYYDLTVWNDCPTEIATERGRTRDAAGGADQKHLDLWDSLWVPKDQEHFNRFHPDQLADLKIKA